VDRQELEAARARSRAAQRIVLAQRARDLRWAAKCRVTLRHPDFGSIEVPHGSNFAALLCAAEAWGVDWMRIREGITFEPWRPGEEKGD